MYKQKYKIVFHKITKFNARTILAEVRSILQKSKEFIAEIKPCQRVVSRSYYYGFIERQKRKIFLIWHCAYFQDLFAHAQTYKNRGRTIENLSSLERIKKYSQLYSAYFIVDFKLN